MWARFRKWKHGVVPLLIVVAVFLIQADGGSSLWYAGVVVVAILGLAYVIEEIVWNVQGVGRPCVNCGHRQKLRSFVVQDTCRNCGAQL
jgi:hypothetical protein